MRKESLFHPCRLIEIKELIDEVRSDASGRPPGVDASRTSRRLELDMSALLKVTALAVTAAVALFVAQPSQAITPVVQPHSIIADAANGDSLVTTVARRGGAYRGGRVYRGRAIYRGRGVYRGGVYRRGVYRRTGLRYGAAAYGQLCGYAPYPPCATGYYGGGSIAVVFIAAEASIGAAASIGDLSIEAAVAE